MSGSRTAFAVVRIDHYLREVAEVRDRVTIKEVLPTLEEAEKEVQRLNELAGVQGRGDDVEYFVQHTRLVGYPESAS